MLNSASPVTNFVCSFNSMEPERNQEINALQLFPSEIWLRISSFVNELELQDLCALSLVCRALRETSLQSLYSTCTFKLGGATQEHDQDSGGFTWTWFLPSEEMERNVLECLGFLTHPTIAGYVKKVTITYLILPRDPNKRAHALSKGLSTELLDNVVLSLQQLGSLERLTFSCLPISNHHLQALCHPSFVQTEIFINHCRCVDPGVGEIPMTYQALRLHGHRPGVSSFDSGMVPIVKATLTPSLTRLNLSGYNHSEAIQQALDSSMCFQALTVLVIDEHTFGLLFRNSLLDIFPNVSHLSVTETRPSDFDSVIPPSIFPRLETLKCSPKFLPRFKERPIHELELFMKSDLNWIKSIAEQCKQLLWYLSSLKLNWLFFSCSTRKWVLCWRSCSLIATDLDPVVSMV
jgi:hypothetical protein